MARKSRFPIRKFESLEAMKAEELRTGSNGPAMSGSTPFPN